MCRVASRYGWTDDYILEMPSDRFALYLKGDTILTAEEALMNLKISMAPHWVEEHRESFFRDLDKIINPETYKPVDMTGDMISRLING